ncbi:uncharacterized protein LOC142232195 [Haematobia irritans]|uniref:uncharacterized protein LOC142232195 n=1 Tax=Haematobia irritans TaxID=7368 RepID=UPI003F4FE96F
MRAFIVLCCLATAYGASLSGYDYERQGAAGFGADQGFNGAGVGAFGGSPAAGVGNFGSSPAAGFGGGVGVGSFGGQSEFTKEFYSFTAPEGAFDDNTGADQLANNVKRGLRVVFIKGPENTGLENAALQLAKSAAGQRTAIYVLNKQADVGDLANKLNSLNQNGANKPEVHFVKYRTQADAENAQRVIQSQYDALGGKTNSFNGGVAPVLDFASKGAVGGGVGSGSPFQVNEPSGSYLPPNKRV